MKEVLHKTKELLERKLDETVSTGNMSANELECVYKAVKTLGQIATIEAMERAQWTEEESRRMHGMSYSGSYPHYEPYWENESMRHRNALGQFTSGTGFDRGYSGHSVNDRMIESLERTITPDMSDMERQRVMEQIRMIRERKD